MQSAYIGLGSNLADPRAQVEAGLRALARLPRTHLLAHSRLYRSAPWGRVDQPEFVNAVAQLETGLEPRALLARLLDVERAAGRERGGVRWGPRVLDLDILLLGNLRIDESGLHVPHPHLHERAFVLVPLAEIAPDLDVPGHGRVADLLAGADASTCTRMAE
ncbi:MAG: 2-amino-4-hydroxy-6-hydroxymethyldihydropteridine diphosphokinase [Proteobacteria bacterium]|nr:2-amino-4-hydroxy-6-hydroxymethyldihydropteridine diphosphokinase [Pseudomonadota bacterium]